MRKKIAYLISEYPMVSHSFIRREIVALESLGFDVLRIAMRGWQAALADPRDMDERSRTRYVLGAGPLSLLWPVASAILKAPVRFLSALRLALRMSRKADRPLPYHLLYLAEACRILPWLQRFGATHLHAHFCSNPTEVAMLAHALGGPRFSFTVHGTAEFDKLSVLGMEHKVGMAAFVVSVSSYGASQIYRRVSHKEWPKIKVVHCGLEKSFFDSQGTSTLATRPRLVCIGRISAEKGQLLLVQAAARLKARGILFELVLAGDGDMRGEVERLIAAHNLQDRITITGWISSDQVREELIASRALVLPSFSEGLPVVIMEAMALRRPVLASSVGGIPELVRPGVDGWLFPPGDVDELANAMARFLQMPDDEIRQMGESAYQRVVARHSIASEVGKLADLITNSGASS